MPDTRVLLIGGTGMVGGLVLSHCLERAEVTRVTSLGRRAIGAAHPKLHDLVHADFMDYTTAAGALGGQDVAFYCLGACTGAVSNDELRRITVDCTAAFAEALHASSPGAVVCFLSGQGADQSAKSRVAMARYKGRAELSLLTIGFRHVHIFRPGYIYPSIRRQEPNAGYRLRRSFYPVLSRVYPNMGITSDDLARAMVHAALGRKPDGDATVLESRDIRALALRSS